MKSWKLIAACAAAFAFSAGANTVLAQHKKGGDGHGDHGQKKMGGKMGGKKGEMPALPNCPVMGGAVDFSVKTMTKDGPAYFCCKMCIKKFNDKPAKYAEGLAEQRKVLAKLPKVQVLCPVSGKAVDKKTFVTDGGQKVLFCCKGCIAKYQKNPGKYKTQLADSYSYQTKCPIMDEKIDPTSFTTLASGQKVYFCCKGCDKKFLKNPAKYAAKLTAQGTNIDPSKMMKGGGKKKDSHKGHGHDGHEGHDH